MSGKQRDLPKVASFAGHFYFSKIIALPVLSKYPFVFMSAEKISETKTSNCGEPEICEACGELFDCGAKSDRCWCSQIPLTAETTKELSQKFKRCLCRRCLAEFGKSNR